MSDDRRTYSRQPEERRRDSLIGAAIDLMAEGGIKAASVRAIAERAGVTPGLIRHYFRSKDDLTREAFRHMMDRMTAESTALAGAVTVEDDPKAALVAIVRASLRPPVMQDEKVHQWAMFLHMIRQDPSLRDVHEEAYLGFRDRLQAVIQCLPGQTDATRARSLAIACNAVIDGLWLEGGTLPNHFEPGEIERIGLASVSAILGISLTPDEEGPR